MCPIKKKKKVIDFQELVKCTGLVLYFINKLVLSEPRMTKWLVCCREVAACLGIRNN